MIRLATPDDAPAILEIYAPIVRETAISFELELPSEAEMRRRIRDVLAARPWLVLEDGHQIAGYVYASTFRERAAYRWVTEVTVYVRDGMRGRGVGSQLYSALFDLLRLQGYCTAIAGATLPNPESVRLHESMGFQPVGVFPNAGFKFDRWYDVGFWQLALRPLPERPAELIALSEVAATEEFDEAIKRPARQR